MSASFLDATARRSQDASRSERVGGGWNACALALAMAAHPRVGACTASGLSQIAASRDLVMQIMKHICLVVPDDAPTLAAALQKACPWQQVLLRAGEHLCSARTAGDPGSSVLRVHSPVRIHGEDGAIIRGTIILEASSAGGSIVNLQLEDGGDCCVRCEGGSWDFLRLRLRCSHGSALLVCGAARITISDCILGGEGEHEIAQHVVMLSAYGSIQETGMSKRACYGIVARDDASIVAHGCVIRECSEAALLVAHRALCQLFCCSMSGCRAAFMSGQGRGRLLELTGCTFQGTIGTMWADPDRPRAFVWGADNHKLHQAEANNLDDEWSSGVILPSRQMVRANLASDSDSDSLQEEAFVDMETLMAELDEQALQEARQRQAQDTES